MNGTAAHIITVFEHDKLTLKHPDLDDTILEQLQQYHGESGTPYFSLIHKGVQFNQFVGVIQVGRVMIEVLPKTDRPDDIKDREEESLWRDILIRMLRQTMGIDAQATSETGLTLQQNSVLDLYLELFLTECERIVRRGRTKQYRQVTRNQMAMKGRLNMSRHVTHNAIHKERFYVEYNTYDHNHLLNRLLAETLRVLQTQFNKPRYYSRIQNLLLEFEDCSPVIPKPEHFENLIFTRKNERYRRALQIARLILLNYHPDLSRGRNHVLALMFDMNRLWEGYVGKMLRKHLGEMYTLKPQQSRPFWKSDHTYRKLRPDFLLISDSPDHHDIILDTKWKTPPNLTPSDEDLRQMFAYNRVFGVERSVLLYPGEYENVEGEFVSEDGGSCGAVFVRVMDGEGNLKMDEDLLLLQYH